MPNLPQPPASPLSAQPAWALRPPEDLLAAIGTSRQLMRFPPVVPRWERLGQLPPSAYHENPGMEAPAGTRLVVIDGPRRFLVRQEDVSGPLVVVHGQPGLDVALVDGQPAPPAPAGGGHLVSSCHGCKASAHLEDGDRELPGCTVLAIVHEPGCPRLDGMLIRAGEPR